MRAYGRKKRPGRGEPNDRQFDTTTERRVKRLGPRELDALLRDGELTDESGMT
jgi:hypothetical protein